jgi:hypothetical protein
VRGTGWDSKLIEYQTRCWCSHVELILPDRHTTFGAQMSGGVHFRTLTDPCYRDVSRWEIWTYPSTAAEDAHVDKYMQETIGEQYDWRAVLAFGLGDRDWRTADHMICSEWAMGLLECTGIARLPDKLPVMRVTPRDVYMIFTVIVGVRRDQALAQQQLNLYGRERGLTPRLSPLVPEASSE